MTLQKFDFLEEEPTMSKSRSVVSAPLKGFVKGVSDITSLLPFGRGPLSPRVQEEVSERILPTRESGLENVLERAGRIAPAFIGGPESILAKGLRSLGAGVLGETAKELGAPEIVQTIAEIPALASPTFGKKILETKKQKQFVDFLRKKGFTEKELTPLIQSPEALDRWAGMAQKGKKTHELMKDIYERFGEVYKGIKTEASQLKNPKLSGSDINEFLGEVQNIWQDISPRDRRLIEDELNNLLSTEISFNDLLNFNQDINAEIRGKTGGPAVIGRLKEPISKAMKKISPELASDYELANKLYAKRADVSSHLRPNQIDSLVNSGEIYGAIAALADRNFGLLSKVFGVVGARQLARELLINPRLQNISNQMAIAVKNNNIPNALKLMKLFKKDLSEEGKAFTESISENNKKQEPLQYRPLFE